MAPSSRAMPLPMPRLAPVTTATRSGSLIGWSSSIEAMDPADVLAISDLLSRYGYIVDEADWERLDEAFAPDATFDISAIGKGAPTGIDALRRCFAELDHPLAHHTTNAVVEPDGTGRAR